MIYKRYHLILLKRLLPSKQNKLYSLNTYLFTDQSITSPHFSGRTSHLSLPTLTNAYSDLQLSLEFRPESADGIILLTGETQEMTGDYLAIILREGHVELR